MAKKGRARGVRNRRYQRTEEAILEVLLKTDEMPTAGELSRRAGISRSTLYRHHRAMPGIIPDYEKEMLVRYRRMIRKLLRQRNASLKSVYLRMLGFILKNKRVMEILFRYEGGRVIEMMVLEVREKITQVGWLPRSSEKKLRICAKEVAGVVEIWGERGFEKEELEGVLDEMMDLTKTVRGRLKALK